MKWDPYKFEYLQDEIKIKEVLTYGLYVLLDGPNAVEREKANATGTSYIPETSTINNKNLDQYLDFSSSSTYSNMISKFLVLLRSKYPYANAWGGSFGKIIMPADDPGNYTQDELVSDEPIAL